MNRIETLTKLFADSFIDDPGIQMQLAGLHNPEEVFYANCKGELEAFDKLGLLTSVDEDGILMGFTSEEAQSEDFTNALQRAPQYLLQIISKEDIALMQSNMMKLTSTVKADWYVKFLGDIPLYNLHVVAVREGARGKGILRKLLTPLFRCCEEEGRPIILQTLSNRAKAIYEHFGFELLETVRSEELGISCYNMIKKF